MPMGHRAPPQAGQTSNVIWTDGWYLEARQPLIQSRSFSGLRTTQMCLIRPPATSNANTVTMTPSWSATVLLLREAIGF
jgi:hypothetical protein